MPKIRAVISVKRRDDLEIIHRLLPQKSNKDKTQYQPCSGFLIRNLTEKAPPKNRKCLISQLTHQGSNLDSSEPKSDVLPVTPWVKIGRKSTECDIQVKMFFQDSTYSKGWST